MTIDVNDRSRGQDQIRGLRLKKGLSQQALAERAGCSLSTIAMLERGYSPKRSPTLDRVLEVLNCGTSSAASPATSPTNGKGSRTTASPAEDLVDDPDHAVTRA